MATPGSGGGELPSWESAKSKPKHQGTGPAARPATSGPPRPKRRWGRLLLFLLGGLVVVCALLLVFAPTIGAAVGPGFIEKAANRNLKGSVKVQKLDIGWFSPMTIGPVEIRDEKGALAARFEANLDATLWRVVRERWWSAKAIDLGVIEVSGMVDAERDAAGGSNIARAVEPKQPASKGAPAGGGSSGARAIKGTVRITNFDVSVHDAGAARAQEIGVKALKGDVSFDYAGSAIVAKADLGATPIGQTSQGPFRVKIDADVKPATAGGRAGATGFDKADVKAEIAGAPIALIDGLAGLGGALVSAIGQTAEVRVYATGNAQAASARVMLASQGTNGTIDLSLKDGVLITAPAAEGGSLSNRITLRSLDFLERLPALRARFTEVARTVRLTGPAPGVEISIERLAIPIPPEVISGTAKLDAAAIDFRKASLVASAKIAGMQGQAALKPGATGAAAADWRAFAIDPVQITLSAPDFAQGATFSANSKATLDGQSAGTLSVQATAAGLLDQQGHLRAAKGGLAERLDADVRIVGVSTALAQPLLTTLGLPLDLREDAGPTLDMSLKAIADTKGGVPSAGELPPTDVSIEVTSANLRLNGGARIEKDSIVGTGDGVLLQVHSAAPLLNRLLNPPALGAAGSEPAPAGFQVGGVGRLKVALSDFAAAIPRLKSDAPLSGLRANIGAAIEEVTIKPAQFAPSAQPIAAQSLMLRTALASGAAPRIDLDALMSHQGQPFTAKGTIALNGLAGGTLPKGGGLDAAFKIGANGQLALNNVPRSVLGALPGLDSWLAERPATATDLNAQIARAAQAALGPGVSVTTTFTPVQGAQGGTNASVQVATQSRAVTAEASASVTSTAATLSTFSLAADINPDTINPVLAAQATTGSPPLRIARPFKVRLGTAGPVNVPLVNRDGALRPDFAGAGDVTINLASEGNLTIDNLAIGKDERGQAKTTQVTLANLGAQISAPLSGLAAGAGATKRAAAKAKATLMQGPGARLADFSLDASAAMDGSRPEGTVRLADVDTQGLDRVLGQNGLLAGALGDRADISAKAAPQGGGGAPATLITAEIASPRLKGANIGFTQSADRTVLTQPAAVTWTPDPAFLNAMLRRPAPAGAPGNRAAEASVTVTQISPITVQLNALSLGASRADATGQPISGPLLPGVFALDALLTTPTIGMVVADAGESGASAPTRTNTPISIEGLRLAARGTGAPGQPPGLDADLSIERITGTAEGGSSKRSGAKLSAAGIADARGVLSTDRAVYNLQADFSAFPTAIVDQLGNQDGVLVELLGPTVDLVASGRDVVLGPASAQPAPASAPAGAAPAVTGVITAKATSARASAELSGDVRDGAFIQTGPLSAKIVEIRPQLARVLRGGLPIVESVTKTREDAPAILETQNMHVPLDKDMRKLNGEARIDPGVARFEVKGGLIDLINLGGGKSGGMIGEKIEPFVVRFNQGVATYDRFTLPVGQFKLETRGTVDLVQRQVDVITYVPIFALTDKAAGGLNTGIAGKLGVLDKNTLVPIRTRGPMDKPKTEIDVGLFAQETAGNLLKAPGQLIEKGIGDALKDVLKPKK